MPTIDELLEEKFAEKLEPRDQAIAVLAARVAALEQDAPAPSPPVAEDEAATAKREHVLKTANGLPPGGIVHIPPGDTEWGEAATLEKVVHLKGRLKPDGKPATRIKLDRPGGAVLLACIGDGFKIQGLELIGTGKRHKASGLILAGTDNVAGYCVFRQFGRVACAIKERHREQIPYSLVHDSSFIENFYDPDGDGKRITHGYGVTVSAGDDVWNVDPAPGSRRMTVMQDCYGEGNRRFFDVGRGAHGALRDSTIVDTTPLSIMVRTHGAFADYRVHSGRWMEVYRNRFSGSKRWFAAVAWMGGDGVFWGNEITDTNQMLVLGHEPISRKLKVDLLEKPAREQTLFVYVWNNSHDLGRHETFGYMGGSKGAHAKLFEGQDVIRFRPMPDYAPLGEHPLKLAA